MSARLLVASPEAADVPAMLARLRGEAIEWTQTVAAAALSWSTAWQLLAILAAALLSYFAARYPSARLRREAAARASTKLMPRILLSFAHVVWPALAVVGLWIATAAFDAAGLPNGALRIAASLLNAWIVVRLITSNMKDGFWASAVAVLAWTVAALYILRLLGPVASSLDGAAIQIGAFRLSLLRVLTSVVVAVVALWAGRIAGDVVQTRLRSSRSLTPSIAGLLGQVLRITFVVLAVVITLYAVGVNLTAFTVLSGAIGVGIGFGLQSIFSNFISGIIILVENSVKVGDFIELQSGVTGLVKEINIRSTLITTNDNVDILVPNEEFIKAQVTNWTLREAQRRVRIPFGVAYGSDKELVRAAGLEAAAEVPWTFDDKAGRAPQVWLVGFGDSSLDFELVVWLTEEAVKKPAKVHADYNWALHSALEKYGLEIPFPQRDLHLKTPERLRVEIKKAD
jgi:small-conductance mechanosensitive channel